MELPEGIEPSPPRYQRGVQTTGTKVARIIVVGIEPTSASEDLLALLPSSEGDSNPHVTQHDDFVDRMGVEPTRPTLQESALPRQPAPIVCQGSQNSWIETGTPASRRIAAMRFLP